MPIKILAECFVAIPQLIVKFLWKFKGTTVVQTIFEKKRKLEDSQCLSVRHAADVP